MKTTRHSLMAKGIMVLLSLLVLIFAFTYSWFTAPEVSLTANGISVAVDSSGDFQYAIGFQNSETGYSYKMTDFTNSSSALNLEHLKASDNEYYNLLHDYSPIDVTEDGATLIRPAMSYGNSAINTESVNYSIADPNVQYITFDLFFRSESSGFPIKLGKGSYAIAACEDKRNGMSDVGNGALTDSSKAGSNGFSQSSYGAFSKDAIVGAVRVAFVPYTIGESGVNSSNYNKDTSSFIIKDSSNTTLWLPRPDIHVNTNDTTTGWTLSTATYPASYSDDDATQTFYNIFKNYASTDTTRYHKIESFPNTITPSSLALTAQQFTQVYSNFVVNDNGTNYYYSKVNVRIWVEGTDAESRRAFSGGRFAVNFKFTTY